MDIAFNGLQFGQDKLISKIALCPDSTIQAIHLASELQADVLIVHHGIIWKQPNPITRSYYQKLKQLFQSNLALLAYHIPLDAHATIGNNAFFANLFQVKQKLPFAYEKGVPIGQGIILSEAMNQSQILALLQPYTKNPARPTSPFKEINKIAISSGKLSSSFLEEAILNQYELIITGEIDLTVYNSSQDNNLPIIPLGHYYSEIYGLKLLEKWLNSQYEKIDTYFIDLETSI